jgi:hypothetical protein
MLRVWISVWLFALPPGVPPNIGVGGWLANELLPLLMQFAVFIERLEELCLEGQKKAWLGCLWLILISDISCQSAEASWVSDCVHPIVKWE